MNNGDGRECSKCREWKPWSGFHRNRDGPNGHCSHCKDCRSIAHQERKTHKDEIRQRLDAKYADRDQLAAQGMKRCSRCKKAKPFDCFTTDARRPDGCQSQCRDCYTDQKRTPQRKEKLWLREHGLKRCVRCKRVKQFSEFYKNSHMEDGCQSHCKVCIREKVSPAIIERERLRSRKLKRCIICQQIKELGAFNRFVGSADGRTSYCRKCSKKLNQQWAQDNPMKVRIQARTRRARKLEVGGDFDENDIQKLHEAQDGICTYFGIDPECVGELSLGFHIDHIIPLSRAELNPSNAPDNLQLLCPHCNSAKWSRTHDEFITWLQEMA